MKRLLYWLAPLLLALTTSGLAQDVKYNFDPKADFSKYKTYMWGQVTQNTAPDQLIDRQIKDAIDTQLTSKGLTKREGGTIDLVLVYQVRLSQEKQIDAYTMPGWGWGWGGGMGTMTTSTINIGTVVLDMYDVSSRQMVWRGYAQKTLNPSKKPEKNQERLQKAMAKLLKNYPPNKK